MRLPTLTPRTYRTLTLVALVAVAFIIITGAAVRLTGSGLGCSDWPTCEQDRLVAPLELHPMVEFVNRTITGLVSVAVIVAVLGSLFRRPRRRDLIWLSWGLVAGVIGQIVLGGLTVLFELRPPFVMAHFLLSLVILADAVVLHHRAGEEAPPMRTVASLRLRRVARVVMGLTCVAVFTGTIVTAAGPHGGDEDAERLSWALPDVTRVHAATVIVLVASVIILLLMSRAERQTRLVTIATALLVTLAVQGAIGYFQYFNGVPALLVGFHVAGAVVAFSIAVWAQLALREPAGESAPHGPAAAPREAQLAG